MNGLASLGQWKADLEMRFRSSCSGVKGFLPIGRPRMVGAGHPDRGRRLLQDAVYTGTFDGGRCSPGGGD
jgi:hypothetical protein